MPEELLPDETGDNQEEKGSGNAEGPGTQRRRRRVRKRIRIKKKPSAKKKIKKIGEKVLWIIFIVGFIITMLVMMKQLDVTDDNPKGKKKKTSSEGMITPPIQFLKIKETAKA